MLAPNSKLSTTGEWLEADGLGGFASGTTTGIRTRRYHALLLTATTPPTGRIVLVNGFDAWAETANGTFSLSSQCYAPGVIGGDGAQRIEAFGWEPWPHWIFKLEDGTRIELEILAVKGEPTTCLSWKLLGPRKDVKLFVRPFLSGRDFHSLHKSNPGFRFDAEVKPDRVSWQPYASVPGVTALTNGSYSHQPNWHYNFQACSSRRKEAHFKIQNPKSEIRNGGNLLTSAATSDETKLLAAVEAILDGYCKGTRYNIRADHDGLLMAGERGVQLTWMDAKVGEWVVTPRVGKPVEVQALWLNALWIASQQDDRWKEPFQRGLDSFQARFWNPDRQMLYDVIDVDHQPGAVDATFRPNQIFAVGGLPLRLIEDERALQIVKAVKDHLWTPLGLRSLAPGESGYTPHYRGGVHKRDGAYHQGTVWPWLLGAFVDGWAWAHKRTCAALQEARREYLQPLLEHLEHAGLGHVSEIADAEPPHTPRGCPWQAWSVGEALWLDRVVLAQPPSRSTGNVRRSQLSRKLAEKPRHSAPSRDLVSA